jgi:hypothetical protein
MLLFLFLLVPMLMCQPLQLSAFQVVYGPSHPEVKFTLEGQTPSKRTIKFSIHSIHHPVLMFGSNQQICRRRTQALGTPPKNKSTSASVFQHPARVFCLHCPVFLFGVSMAIALVLNSCAG